MFLVDSVTEFGLYLRGASGHVDVLLSRRTALIQNKCESNAIFCVTPKSDEKVSVDGAKRRTP